MQPLEARENVRDLVAVGFRLHLIGWARDTSFKEVLQNQMESPITCDTTENCSFKKSIESFYLGCMYKKQLFFDKLWLKLFNTRQ